MLFDQLVSARIVSPCLDCPRVDDELEFGRRHGRHIGRLADLPMSICEAGRVVYGPRPEHAHEKR